MIKPATLWALFKTCPDSKWIGDICRSLGGQDVELDYGQKQVVAVVKQDSEWMDERIEWERERHRKNVAAYRERQRTNNAENATVTDVTVTGDGDRHVTPSVRPSVPPSYENINTDTDTDRGSRGANHRDRGRGISLDVFGMTDDEIFSGTHPTTAMIKAVCGDGPWRKAIDQIGEDIVLGDLVAFVHEIKAGEEPRNAGAAFTARLKRLGAFANS